VSNGIPTSDNLYLTGKTRINGVPVADLTDAVSNMRKGFIGLQVHHIKEGTGPFKVGWRNIRIRELSQEKLRPDRNAGMTGRV
jgi:hypothetical protein